MSIKTLRKRIALVAVSALGVGLLSVAPASATPGALTVNASSLGICASDSAIGLTTIAMQSGGSLIISVAASANTDTIKTSGVLNITGFASIGGAISTDQKKFTISDTTAGTVTFTPSGVGSAVISTQTAGAGANVQTVNVTVLASCAGVNTPAASTSFVQATTEAGKIQTEANLGTTTYSSDLSFSSRMATSTALNTSVDVATTYNNAATAYIHVIARDAYKNYLAGTDYYYGLACTGDAVVNGGTTNGGFIAGVASKYTAEFSVAQGTANVPLTTTCTVTVNNVALASKTLTFRGDLAKIEASLRTVGASGTAAGDATAGTISYKFFDAAGNRLATSGAGLGNPELTATGSALINAISSVTATTSTTTGRLSYNCVGATKSGDVSLVIKRTNAAGATISAPAFTASCGGSLDTYTASLDKATYNVGDIATLTIKGLDANGKKVNDAVTAGTGAAITVNGMTAVTAPSTADLFVNGELVYTYKVDNTAGNYVASVYLPSAGTQTTAVTQKVAITAQAGVSNTEVLAAIVKLIASINKQIRALQKSLRR